MFRTKTLFVIGAGASCELGLPAGGELRHHIMDALDTEHNDSRRGFKNLRVDEAVREAASDVDQARWAQNFADFRETAMKMRVSLPLAQSIDNYLEAHRGNEKIELLGKIAIALSILDAEKKSSLMYEVPSPNRPQGWNKDLLAS